MKRISGWSMAVMITMMALAMLIITGCSTLDAALHGNPAPRAVSLLPSCFLFCFVSTTATYTRGDEIAPGAPASSTTSTTDHH